jgi:hypothetical protein
MAVNDTNKKTITSIKDIVPEQEFSDSSDPSQEHPDYARSLPDWSKVRDCILGESRIKDSEEIYLPRPAGMSGQYADAYTGYLARAHFPQVAAYALQGALGVIITKTPEFNMPKKLEYLKKNATKDGLSLKQLFLNIVIEILTTGRVPLIVDIIPETSEFKFVQYRAEDFINWKSGILGSEKNLTLAVIKEAIPGSSDIFSHDKNEIYRVLYIDKSTGKYSTKAYLQEREVDDFFSVPTYMGKSLDELPIFIAGSINNDYDVQPTPLLSVANCSIQIYRKEADLSNSEYLSCNPTLIFTGVSNDDELPQVVGSSVLIALPDPQARGFYTKTDTAALTHVKEHIKDLYEEAIRHGVAILDTRKGVESAEALRIRQATQSATIYSMYLSATNVLVDGLKLICRWAGYNEDEVTVDAPSSLSYDIPDAQILQTVNAGFGTSTIPLTVLHRYLVSSGLLEQTVGYEEYIQMLKDEQPLRIELAKTSGEALKAGMGDSSNDTPPDKDVVPTDNNLDNRLKSKGSYATGEDTTNLDDQGS